jgi:CubicO group peptidase (beta-lactamase class C family)
MAGQPLQFKPGSKSVYSNFGYSLLGQIIEKVTGRTYVDYVRTELLAPLGITTINLGHTLLSERAPGEPRYTDPGLGPNVVQPDATESVAAPDGTFYLEAMDSHGGLIGSAPDLARFLHVYTLDGLPRAGGLVSGCFFGALPGTFVMALQRADGIEIAALFNQSQDPFGPDYHKIEMMLEKAVDSIQKWPMK